MPGYTQIDGQFNSQWFITAPPQQCKVLEPIELKIGGNRGVHVYFDAGLCKNRLWKGHCNQAVSYLLDMSFVVNEPLLT